MSEIKERLCQFKGENFAKTKQVKYSFFHIHNSHTMPFYNRYGCSVNYFMSCITVKEAQIYCMQTADTIGLQGTDIIIKQAAKKYRG